MAKGSKRSTSPEVIVNGSRLDVLECVVEETGERPNIAASVTFRIGRWAHPALILIGSQMTVEVAEFIPSTMRVVGVEELIRNGQTTYEIRLRQVPSAPDPLSIAYGAALQTVMNQIRVDALIDLLESRGVATSAEFESRVADVAEKLVLHYAAEIVSPVDAAAMRDYVLSRLPHRSASSALES